MSRNAIADRIEVIIQENSESIKDFANTIGVQRSSLSHILSGRNKPSLDFILRVLQAFPEINEKWLLHGKGSSLDTTVTDDKENSPVTNVTADNQGYKEEDVTNVTRQVDDAYKSKQTRDKSQLTSQLPVDSNKRVKQVLILYADGSFESFTPNQSSE